MYRTPLANPKPLTCEACAKGCDLCWGSLPCMRCEDWKNAKGDPVHPKVPRRHSTQCKCKAGRANVVSGSARSASGKSWGLSCKKEGRGCTAACKHPDCVFPFTYYGVTYNACTDIGEKGKGSWDYMWCSTEKVFKVGSNKFRKCDGCSRTDAGCKACADDEKSEKAETGLACRCRSGFFDINPDADDLVCTKLGEGCEKSSKSSPCTQCFDNATATLSADKKRCVCRAGYVTELDRSIVHGKPTKTW